MKLQIEKIPNATTLQSLFRFTPDRPGDAHQVDGYKNGHHVMESIYDADREEWTRTISDDFGKTWYSIRAVRSLKAVVRWMRTFKADRIEVCAVFDIDPASQLRGRKAL